jgi:hypothetical protein
VTLDEVIRVFARFTGVASVEPGFGDLRPGGVLMDLVALVGDCVGALVLQF